MKDNSSGTLFVLRSVGIVLALALFAWGCDGDDVGDDAGDFVPEFLVGQWCAIEIEGASFPYEFPRQPCNVSTWTFNSNGTYQWFLHAPPFFVLDGTGTYGLNDNILTVGGIIADTLFSKTPGTQDVISLEIISTDMFRFPDEDEDRWTYEKMCPSTVSIASLHQIPVEAATPFLRTGVGAASIMEVGPSNVDWTGATVVEEVMALDAGTCPTGWAADLCVPGGMQFTVDSEEDHVTGLRGLKCPSCDPPQQVSVSVDIQQPPNSFFDVHAVLDDESLLHSSNLPNCSLRCRQVYKCGGQEIGSFIVEFSFERSEAIDPQGATVFVTRVSADKTQ